MTALAWDDYASGGDADPQAIFGAENKTPAARGRRTLIALGTRTACFGQHDLFFGRDGESFPERQKRVTQAKALCRGCPVRPACREYALTSGQEHGVWAGLTEEELAAERRRGERAA